MFRRAFMMGALVLAPVVAAAQQPCTTDARSVVNVVYQHILERGADNASGPLADRLDRGNVTVRELIREMAKSREHLSRFLQGQSHEEGVALLYRHLLGREPDPEGMRAYTAIIKNQGVNQAIDGLLNSDEYRRNAGEWGVPGSGIRYCAPGTTSSNTTTGTTATNVNGRMRYRGMDRNNDGAISRSEWTGTRESFVVNDWNGDNVLSGDEVMPGAQRNANNNNNNNNRVMNPARFRDLDTDRDGNIDRGEWRDSADAFDWLDRDNNNLLSRAEVTGRTGAAAQPQPTAAVDPFDELDTNNDGRVSLREYRWSRRQFVEQDTNDDGVLTRREFNETGGVPTSGVR
jgi:Ca2+-binding EF-hand superfamily protein